MSLELLAHAAALQQQVNNEAAQQQVNDEAVLQQQVDAGANGANHQQLEKSSRKIKKKKGNSILQKSPVMPRALSTIDKTKNNTIHTPIDDDENYAYDDNYDDYYDDFNSPREKKKKRKGKRSKEELKNIERNSRAWTAKCFGFLKEHLPKQYKLTDRASVLLAALDRIQTLEEYEMEKIQKSQQKLTETLKLENIDEPNKNDLVIIPDKSIRNNGVKKRKMDAELKVCKTSTKKSEIHDNPLKLMDKFNKSNETPCGFCLESIPLGNKRAHLTDQHGAKFNCLICYKDMVDEKSLIKHEAQHDKGGAKTVIFHCPYNSCGFSNKRLYWFLDHVRRTHLNKMQK